MTLRSEEGLRKGILVHFTAVVLHVVCMLACVRLPVALGSRPRLGVRLEVRYYA